MNIRHAHTAVGPLIHMVAALLEAGRNSSYHPEMHPVLEKAEKLLASITETPADTLVDCKAIMAQTNGEFDPNMNAYAVLFRHDHGLTSFVVTSDHHPTEQEIAEHCKILFEPEIGEEILVDVLLTNPVTIPATVDFLTMDVYDKIEYLAKKYSWSDIEKSYAMGSVQHYGTKRNETVIPLANGRSIHCPAFPDPCDYVRIVQDGFELAYWSSEEWTEAPEEVMGAFLGAARASRKPQVREPNPDADEFRCEKCGDIHDNDDSIRCPQCGKLCCDNCYDTTLGDGCHCHGDNPPCPHCQSAIKEVYTYTYDGVDMKRYHCTKCSCTCVQEQTVPGLPLVTIDHYGHKAKVVRLGNGLGYKVICLECEGEPEIFHEMHFVPDSLSGHEHHNLAIGRGKVEATLVCLDCNKTLVEATVF